MDTERLFHASLSLFGVKDEARLHFTVKKKKKKESDSEVFLGAVSCPPYKAKPIPHIKHKEICT